SYLRGGAARTAVGYLRSRTLFRETGKRAAPLSHAAKRVSELTTSAQKETGRSVAATRFDDKNESPVLRMRGCRSWSRRGRGFVVVEVHFGGLARAFLGLEIGVVAREASETGNQTVREQGNVGVVVLNRIVVALALHSDTVFRAGQFILQAHEIFVRFQLRVVFHDDHQPAQCGVQLSVRRDFVGRGSC